MLLGMEACCFAYKPYFRFVLKMEKKGEIHEIGGIRGWAAFVVFIFHSFSSILSPTRPEIFTPENYMFSVWDGPLMVSIFFVISGDALSVSFTRRVKPGMSPTVPLKRVLRLSGMAMLTFGLSFIAISNGLVKNAEAGRILNNYWLEGLLPENLSGLSVDLDVFYAGFIGMYDQKPRLNLFLWTMGSELAGSVVVFAIGSVFPRLRFHPVILLLAIWFYYYFNLNIALFIVGILLGYCRSREVFSTCHRILHLRVLFGILVITLPVIHRFTYLPVRESSPGTAFGFIFYSLFCIYASKDAVWFFSTRLSRFLGEISFPFYALSLFVISCIVRFIEMGYLRILDKAFGLFVDPEEGVLPYYAVPQVKEAELECISVVSRKMKHIE